MDTKHFSYDSIPQLSSRDRDYINKEKKLDAFINGFPSIDNFRNAIRNKSFDKASRSFLVKNLKDQNKKFDVHPLSLINQEQLNNENCFTIITAHQPSLFTGPLYFVFKILSTINLCRRLNKEIPTNTFVPVFVLGAEDHDFDEINHLNIYGKTIVWDKESEGPVGRLDLHGLKQSLDQLIEFTPNNNLVKDLFDDIQALIKSDFNYRDFSLALVHRLFGRFGLVPVSMDNEPMKRKLIPFLKKEIFENKSLSPVQETQKKLAKLDYDAQAYVRPINVFYMTDEFRGRLELIDDRYVVIGTDLSFSKEELELEIDQNPIKFSPNVVLRPLYQELIFPNIAYVGGGGELAYWMERKTQFESFGIAFPILVRRNSAMILEAFQLNKINKLGIPLGNIFRSEHELLKAVLHSNVDTNLFDYRLEKSNIQTQFITIAQKAKVVDPTLEKSIMAEATKVIKLVDNLSSKVEKRLKNKEDVQLKQVKKIKESLFPAQGLQERYDNIFAFLPKYGEELIDKMLDHLDPLKNEFTVLLPE